MIRIRKGILYITAILIAVLIALGVGLLITPSKPANAAVTAENTNQRVTMLDLMARYPIDYVVGPIDAQDVKAPTGVGREDIYTGLVEGEESYAGQYHYKTSNFELDSHGNPVEHQCSNSLTCGHQVAVYNGTLEKYQGKTCILTNNAYGIPANKYFNVEAYIYTNPNTVTLTKADNTQVTGRVLRGWQADIRAVLRQVDSSNRVVFDYTKKIAENGEIMTDGGRLYDRADETNIGIYVTYVNNGSTLERWGTTDKYAMIVPSDVVRVGRGSGAYVYNNSAYYDDAIETGTDAAKFTDFSCFITNKNIVDANGNISPNSAPYFWQPRERLAGVYFTNDSTLVDIQAGATGTDNANSGRSRTDSKNKSAFQDCNNMRFMILPNRVETIGDFAFNRCSLLLDTNIPTSVTKVGNKAYYYCGGMLHITIPNKTLTWGTNVFTYCSKIKHVDNDEKYTSGSFATTDSTIFVMGNKPVNGVLDTGAFLFEKTKDGVVSAIALAGATGEDASKVFVFPSATSFNDNSDRRNGVAYDYLDSNGNKIKLKNISDLNVKSYDIAPSFANSIWCQNVVIPEEVSTIGDNAFYDSHVKYLETYATTIGSGAFKEKGTSIVADQWFYFHKQVTSASGAFEAARFVASSGTSRARHIVYENEALYNKYKDTNKGIPTWIPTNNSSYTTYVHYQIPITAHIDNQDTASYQFKDGDLAEPFFNDSDYVENPEIEPGNHSFIYTKRLNNYGNFNYIKQRTGEWLLDEDTAKNMHSSPTISNMTNTVWYSEANCNDGNQTSASASQFNIYTKILVPKIVYPDWASSFKVEMEDVKNKDEYSFNALLGLNNDDYEVSLTTHTTHWGVALTETPTYVSAAGTYSLTIQLKSDRWGKWVQPKPITVTINQMEIDLGNLDNIPTFYALNTRTSEYRKLESDIKTTLYEHIDGWSMTSSGNLGSVELINSYTGYVGGNISLACRDSSGNSWTKYDIAGDASSQLVGLNSDRYSASYTFSVKNANYKFVYTSIDTNQADFTLRRMGFATGSMLERSAVFSKQWYITKTANWLVNAGSTETDPTKNEYKLAVKDDGSGEVITSWEYEFDGYTINLPALAFGGDLKLTATISRNGTQLKDGAPFVDGVIDAKDLKLFFNSSIPAGEYDVLITAPSVDGGKYPAFSSLYKITVTPKAFDETLKQNVITALNNQTFESAHTGKLYLHDSLTALSELNDTLNTNWKNSTADNSYWKSHSEYYPEIALKYNLDALQTSEYFVYTELATKNAAPINVGQYLVYYSISAPNYITVGEVDVDPTEENPAGIPRRDYRFTTVIFGQLSAENLKAEILKNAANYKYTGSRVEATVPYSVNYTYSFDDGANAYVNVGNYTVTVKIGNPLLLRWNETSNVTVVSDTNKSQVIKITYSIIADDNGWRSTPQMIGWNYKGFDQATHIVTSTLKYTGATVYYKLVDASVKEVNLGNNAQLDTAVNGSKNYFTVTNGQVDANVMAVLNGLPAGNYTLCAYVSAIGNNVNDYVWDEGSSVLVSKATNSWTITPNIIPWTWGEYSKTVNTISAQPFFDEDKNVKITYTILNGSEVAVNTTLTAFTEVNDTVAAALMALDAGSYTLRASLAGTANYNAIPDTKVPFTILVAQNTWTTSPRMTTWQYKQFTAASNFVAGIPTYGTTVTYGIYDSDPADGTKPTADKAKKIFTLTVTRGANGTVTVSPIDSDVETYLSTLEARTVNYYLVAYVDGSANQYGDLYREISFSVNKATTNSWKTLPAISGWTYNEYNSSLFTAGVADFGTVKYTVQTVGTDGNTNLSGYIDLTLSDEQPKLALNGLDAGNYNLRVTVAGTDNYIGALHEIRFTVAKAKISWDTVPSISESWTYGNTPSDRKGGTVKTIVGVNIDVAVAWYETKSNNGQLEVDYDAPVNGMPTNAGTYAYVVTASATGAAKDNYEQLIHVSFFTINKATRTWDTEPADSDLTWTYGNETVIKSSVNFKCGNETITYLVDGEPVNSDDLLNKLINKLKRLEYGSHTLTATVVATKNYEQLTRTVNISVTRATNSWHVDKNVEQLMKLASSWKWNTVRYDKDGNDLLGWSYPVPEYGSSVNITIKKSANSQIIYGTTLSYDEHELIGNDNGIIAQLLSLDAGSYVITAVIPQSDCYNVMEQNINFTVEKATNGWKIVDTVNNLEYIKTYSNGVTRILMEPIYGTASDVKIEYCTVGDDGKLGEWTTSIPTKAGNYQFKATVEESANWLGCKFDPTAFELDKESNGWIVVPGVNGWEWGKFNKNENIFRGTAVSDGTVSFRISVNITGGTTSLSVSDFSPEITPADLAKLQNFTVEENSITVSEEIAAILKKLKPGSYLLTATASGGSEFESLSASNSFTVSRVNNEWGIPAGSTEGTDIDIYPSVNTFVYGTTGKLNKGSTKYGDVNDTQKADYRIYKIVGNEKIHVSTYTSSDAQFFSKLEVGNYVLQVWIKGGDTYNDLYSATAPYTTPFSIVRAQNSWKDNTPPTSITKYYEVLQGENANLLLRPSAQQGTAVYQLLKTDYSPAIATADGEAQTFSYEQLLGGVQSLNAGDYIIRISLVFDKNVTQNYEDLRADISLSIKSYKTVFVNLPNKLSGQWQENNTTIVAPSNLYAIYDEEARLDAETSRRAKIVYSYGSVVEGTWNDLVNEVKGLSAGSYQIVVTAMYSCRPDHPEDINICEVVSEIIQLDIRQGANEWQDNWKITDSISSEWTWGSAISWTNAVPKYGKTVYVEVRKDGASEALNYITVNYNGEDKGASAIASVGTAISALDVGEYVFIVSSPADTNWAALTSRTTFKISPDGNAWVSDPNLLVSINNKWQDAAYNQDRTGRVWTYNTVALPEATALYGTVSYTYYAQGSNVALSDMPANAGKYKVVFSVAAPDSGNYAPLSGEINFEILKASDSTFIVSSGTTGWTWKEYDRTVNLFTGIPTTRGAVSFAVLQGGKIVSVNGTKLEDIQLVNDKGEHTGNPDKDVYVTKEIGELLNKLDAGSYTLRIIVAEVDNYIGFPNDTTFTVSPATNVWTTTPRIVSWSLGEWVAKDNTPKAEAKYGEVNIVISSRVEGDEVIYYSSIYNEQTGKRTVVNKLNTAPAGWYVMKATVVAVTGNFTEILPEEYEFQVFVTGSNKVINSWITDATISSWTASKNIEDINMPEASPLRGLTWFEFTDRISGKKITVDDESFEIEAGTTYFQNFYIPMAPGKYSMTAYAARLDENGNTFDRIYSESVNFEIFYRENSWESEPRISSILYLGEKSEWEGPTATAVEAESKITYSFRYADTGLPIGSDIPMVNGIPAKAGKYLLTATAKAEYCSELVSHDVEFTVDYSYNGWISGVRIENWSAEYEPNDPTAEALYGTDKIVYKYATQEAPDEFLPGKPTEEGNYIVYAIIDCEEDGYANISDSFYFTIEPAYDIDLLIVDIVLGTVGCAMAIGVIYLALRKRKRM